jgi:hypothetical protein
VSSSPEDPPPGPAEAPDAPRRVRTPPPPDRADRRPPTTRRRIEAKLSSRTQLRDAFVLYEVLGPPVSLRDPGSHRPGG